MEVHRPGLLRLERSLVQCVVTLSPAVCMTATIKMVGCMNFTAGSWCTRWVVHLALASWGTRLTATAGSTVRG
jgi:hypothetical protein